MGRESLVLSSAPAPLSHPQVPVVPSILFYPDSCPQNNQFYEEVVDGSLGAKPATAEITAVSTGSPSHLLGTRLGQHGLDG